MFIINKDAAEFLLAQIAKNPTCTQPLRLKQVQKGCGDVGHKFETAHVVLPTDTMVEEHGLTIVCNFDEFSDFENATLSLVENPSGTFARQKIVVIPFGSTVCGCGESATKPQR